MKLNILTFGAHPDDVELGCSGTILKHISLGKKVGIIDLTKGELGTRGTAAIRAQEAKIAAKILGVAIRENLSMADGFFINDKEHQIKVIQKIRQYQPDVVIANALTDRHPDHGRGAQLVSHACFLSGLPKIKTQTPSNSQKGGELAYTNSSSEFIPTKEGGRFRGVWQKAWRPKAVYHYIQYNPHKPDFVVDISKQFEKKMEAIAAFGSQFYNPDSKEAETLISSPEFLRLVKKRGEEHGKQIGVRYGEGFLFGTLHWKEALI